MGENLKNDGQALKGILDMLVLHILAKGENYGFGILQKAEQSLNSGSILKEATLYPLLHRLEDRALVRSSFRQGDRGTARKYYELTPEGQQHLENRIQEWEGLLPLLKAILSGNPSRRRA